MAIYGMYTDYQEQKKIKAYFTSIQQEVIPAIASGKSRLTKIDTLIYNTRQCLKLMNTKDKDTLVYLNDFVEPLVYFNNQNLDFPTIREFINNGYFVKIKDKEMMKLLRQLQQQLSNFNMDNQHNRQRYLTAIEPFVNRHFNYYTISSKKTQKHLVYGGPVLDHEKLYDNAILWNLLSQKLEHFKKQKNQQEKFLNLLQDVNENLNIQLE